MNTAGVATSGMPLAARVAGFVAHIRHNEIEAEPAETDAALRVLAHGPFPTLDEARRRLKILLTARLRRADDPAPAAGEARGMAEPDARLDGL